MSLLTPAATADATDPSWWRARFDEPAPMTIGVEEELMLLDARTLDLAPCAAALCAEADDPRIRTELPAAQLELVTGAGAGAAEARAELAALRRRATELAAAHGARLAGAGAHPFAAPEGALNEHPRYDRIAAEYGPVARRQLVFGLHVHVCVRGADRALAVYNALRTHLPAVAALAANAPLYDGADTGLASVRPKLSELLPRQGVPPAFPDWDAVAAVHAWGRASGRVPEPASWWWEARLHPAHGTIEVRVPDAQTTLGETAAVVALVHALTAWLAARHDAGDLPAPVDTWRIEENRWSACRHGLDATLADPADGRVRPARAVLGTLLDAIGPCARELGCDAELADAATLVECNGALRQRAVAARGGAHAATAWLAERFAA